MPTRRTFLQLLSSLPLVSWLLPRGDQWSPPRPLPRGDQWSPPRPPLRVRTQPYIPTEPTEPTPPTLVELYWQEAVLQDQLLGQDIRLVWHDHTACWPRHTWVLTIARLVGPDAALTAFYRRHAADTRKPGDLRLRGQLTTVRGTADAPPALWVPGQTCTVCLPQLLLSDIYYQQVTCSGMCVVDGCRGLTCAQPVLEESDTHA